MVIVHYTHVLFTNSFDADIQWLNTSH